MVNIIREIKINDNATPLSVEGLAKYCMNVALADVQIKIGQNVNKKISRTSTTSIAISNNPGSATQLVVARSIVQHNLILRFYHPILIHIKWLVDFLIFRKLNNGCSLRIPIVIFNLDILYRKWSVIFPVHSDECFVLFMSDRTVIVKLFCMELKHLPHDYKMIHLPFTTGKRSQQG